MISQDAIALTQDAGRGTSRGRQRRVAAVIHGICYLRTALPAAKLVAAAQGCAKGSFHGSREQERAACAAPAHGPSQGGGPAAFHQCLAEHLRERSGK